MKFKKKRTNKKKRKSFWIFLRNLLNRKKKFPNFLKTNLIFCSLEFLNINRCWVCWKWLFFLSCKIVWIYRCMLWIWICLIVWLWWILIVNHFQSCRLGRCTKLKEWFLKLERIFFQRVFHWIFCCREFFQSEKKFVLFFCWSV